MSHWKDKQGTNEMVVWESRAQSEGFLFFLNIVFIEHAIFKTMLNESQQLLAFIDIILASLFCYF